MHIMFNAQEVDYGEALDGDIIQVLFQEYPYPQIDYSKKNWTLPPIKSVSFSASYEFPPFSTFVDWCDGKEEDGGALIKEIQLTKTLMRLKLNNNISFEVTFKTDDITFEKIERFLLRSNCK